MKQKSTKYQANNIKSRIQSDIVRLSKLISLKKLDTQCKELKIREYKAKANHIESIVNKYNKSTGKAGEEVVKAKQEISNNLVSIVNLIKESIEINQVLIVPTIDFDLLLKYLEKGILESDIARIKIKPKDFVCKKDMLKEFFSNNISTNKTNTKIGLSMFNLDSFNIGEQETLSEILDVFVELDYIRKIELNINYETFFDLDIELELENNNYKSVTQMSAGQIGKIYFKKIIKRDINKDKVNVVFFDQPENNLEKYFILNDLSTLLNELKQKLQIIITTHEPLLVINADSNNIILAKNDKNISGANDILYENVSLIESDDKMDSINTISKLIDGSINAVSKRNEIYGGIISENKTN